MKARLKQFALRALLAADGLPMPEGSLIGALQNGARPAGASVAECLVVLGELEQARWIAAVHDELTNEKSYTLTDKGRHKAQQL